MKKHNKPELRNRRKELRQNLTPAEAFLWRYLQNKKLAGRKFRRQHGIGSYIVDFYCASERLIVELDGEVHNNPVAAEKDERRTKYPENLDYRIIRFENKMVFDHLTSVLREIQDNFKK